jgi:hypothetical protein
MKPLRTKSTEMVYRGPTEDIGDLWVHRVRHGVIISYWKPDEQELEFLKSGGALKLTLFSEPIPPIEMHVVSCDEAQIISAEHTFRVPRELEERRAAED